MPPNPEARNHPATVPGAAPRGTRSWVPKCCISPSASSFPCTPAPPHPLHQSPPPSLLRSVPPLRPIHVPPPPVRCTPALAHHGLHPLILIPSNPHVLRASALHPRFHPQFPAHPPHLPYSPARSGLRAPPAHPTPGRHPLPHPPARGVQCPMTGYSTPLHKGFSQK